MIINTNTNSLFTQRALSRVTTHLETPLERLSSGLRINAAHDDAAGSNISERLSAQINGADQARRNTNDGVSAVQTAEGALTASAEILQRIRTLAVQSANDTNSAADRDALQGEVRQLLTEFDRVATETEFNGKKLLNGSMLSTQLQVGANRGEVQRVGTQSALAMDMRNYEMPSDVTTTSSMVAAQTATSDGSALQRNRVQSQNLMLKSKGFTGTAVVQPGTSAREIALRINESIPLPGITAARAETYAVLTMAGTNTAGLDFQLNGVNIQSFTNNSSTDMDGLIQAINQVSSATGVVASQQAVPGGMGVLLYAAQGEDIQLSQVSMGVGSAGGAGTMSVQGAYNNNGTIASAGGAVALTAGAQATNNRNTTVGGRLLISNDSAFTLIHTAAGSTGGLFAVSSSSLVVSAKGGTLSGIDISTALGSNSALAVVDAALSRINLMRGGFGAAQTRLELTVGGLQDKHERLSASRSRIRDADFAEETADLAKTQVTKQAAMAMLTQANSSPSKTLDLLR